MRHNTLVALFAQFATEHNQIAHDSSGRKSFFMMNKESEINIAINSKIDSPYLCLESASGRMKTSGDVSDETTVTFEVRSHVSKAGNFAEIEETRDECKLIGDQIIAYINEICELQGHCGPIDNFDLNTVQWEYIGPLQTNDYGVRFQFSYSKSSFNQYSFDSSSIFGAGVANYLQDDDNEYLVDDDDDFITD
jgi:hypothetical protein